MLGEEFEEDDVFSFPIVGGMLITHQLCSTDFVLGSILLLANFIATYSRRLVGPRMVVIVKEVSPKMQKKKSDFGIIPICPD